MPTLTKIIQNTIIFPEEKRTAWVAEEAKVAVLMHLGLYEKHFTDTGSKYLIGNSLTCAGGLSFLLLFTSCLTFRWRLIFYQVDSPILFRECVSIYLFMAMGLSGMIRSAV